MLGKGLKRKLEREEENEVMSCPQEASPACYWLQRQTVLNLSLLKLHSRPGHSEPGLARRVLITNTLRHIQDELRREGVPVPESFPSTGPPLGVVDGCRERPADCGVESHSEGSLTPVSRLEEDRHLLLCLSPSISRQQPPSSSVIKDSFSSALAEIEDLCPTVGITTSFTTETGRTLTADPNSDESRQTDPDLSEMNSGMDPASSLSDSAQSVFGHTPSLLADFSLDDFLVTEIDSLLFDNVPCGSSLITSSGASKVVSMVTDDFVKTLAGYGNGGTSQSALPSNQTFKLDLNELDHIMEVLVGS
ncbi:SERTA domain-containing protein 2-like [Sinocyclocheilus rhinocerous]|uniref:SERTA domain-containing protein 2-like n=1 Tax=Sinocyclocheilus rhinocerous TaxID=307959 RepID=A0A673H7N8_9TELE|nr:PREDICTED: SERTA domain-containing protein 2-like [Sinocyclocheilus rhinocerous]